VPELPETRRAELVGRIDGPVNELWELAEAYNWLSDRAGRIPGFRIDPRIILANFAYAKLEMVRDLEGALGEMAGHDIIAALAGDLQAREAIRAAARAPRLALPPDLVDRLVPGQGSVRRQGRRRLRAGAAGYGVAPGHGVACRGGACGSSGCGAAIRGA
jgi:hypothetical protein